MVRYSSILTAWFDGYEKEILTLQANCVYFKMVGPTSLVIYSRRYLWRSNAASGWHASCPWTSHGQKLLQLSLKTECATANSILVELWAHKRTRAPMSCLYTQKRYDRKVKYHVTTLTTAECRFTQTNPKSESRKTKVVFVHNFWQCSRWQSTSLHLSSSVNLLKESKFAANFIEKHWLTHIQEKFSFYLDFSAKSTR